MVGPGACVVTVGPDGRDWLVYHSADPAEPGLSRKLCVAPISWTSHQPRCVLAIRTLVCSCVRDQTICDVSTYGSDTAMCMCIS